VSAPLCPDHSVPMRVSKVPGVAFYCTQRTADGEYCKQSIRAPKPTSIASPPTSPVSPSGDVLAAAALNFAASMYRGAGGELADDAIALAVKAYSAMKAVS